MISLDARELCKLSTPAPALGRGLALLSVLADQQPRTLEALAGGLGIPKASVLRLLSTLQSAGAVRKGADKRYEALWGFLPLAGPSAVLRRRLDEIMCRLCADFRCTVEWYEPEERGMALVRQVHPETGVRVQARPGFLREWNSEFEAVARLGHALHAEAPPPVSPRMYIDDGQLREVSKTKALRLMDDARHAKSASDSAFNENGVRRAAVAAMAGGALIGVLALAETFRFKKRSDTARQLLHLKNALETT